MRTLATIVVIPLLIAATTASCILLDHRNPPPLVATCRQLTDEFTDAIAQRGSCNVDSDCLIVGGQDIPTCNCAPHLGECSGQVIARNAPQLARVRQIERDYWVSCGGPDVCSNWGGCTCDCTPVTGVTCSNHTCVGTPGDTCFGSTPDARDDAWPPPDAYPPDAYVLDAYVQDAP